MKAHVFTLLLLGTHTGVMGWRAPTGPQPRVPRTTISAKEERGQQMPTAAAVQHAPWKMAAKSVLPYISLAGVATGASMLVSSLAGASSGLLVAGCMLTPTVVLLGELLLLGGGKRVAQLMGGRPADAYLTGLVHEVAHRANVQPPTHVFEIPTDEANAFAAGFSAGDMTVAVTSGLRRALYPEELKAVIAHEIGHIQAHDVRRNMHLAAAIAGLGGIYEAGRIFLRADAKKKKRSKEGGGGAVLGIGLMAGGLVAKLGGELLRCAESRHAEFGADQMGARLYGAGAMSSALRKIDALSAHGKRGAPDDLGARGRAFTHAYISNPGAASVDGVRGAAKAGSWWRRVLRAFNTHPTLEERIESIQRHAV